jgi:hypothetical protein
LRFASVAVQTLSRCGNRAAQIAARYTRDTYLGVAALLFAVLQFVNVLQDATAMTLPVVGKWWTATHSVSICAELAVFVGFVFVGSGLLGRHENRSRKIRSGACCIAGGFLLAAVGLVLYAFQYPLARFVHLYHGYQLVGVVAYLVRAVAALWVAWAFSAKNPVDSHARAALRNRRLAWAAVFYALGAVLSIAVHMLYLDVWTFWAHWLSYGTGMAIFLVARQAGDLLRLGAATLAAVGFFVASRPAALGSSGRFARRERLLAWASALLVLSAILFAWGTVSVDWHVRPFAGWTTATYWWLTWLGGLEIAPPAILAAIGFASSRRSLRRAPACSRRLPLTD